MLAYYNEENIDTFTGFLESLREGTDFGLSKNSIVGRKIADALSDQGAWKADEGGFKNLSLVQLAVFSKQTRADYNKLLSRVNLNEATLENLRITNPKAYDKKIKELSEISGTFKALHNIKQDLVKVKLWNNPHNKRALEGLMLADEINDGRFREAQNITSTLISQGLMDDFDMEEPVSISDGSGYDIDEILTAYNESIRPNTTTFDTEEGLITVEDGSPEWYNLTAEKNRRDEDFRLDAVEEGLLTYYDSDRPTTSKESALEFYLDGRNIKDVLQQTNFTESEIKDLLVSPDKALVLWAANQGTPRSGKRVPSKGDWRNIENVTAEEYKEALWSWKHANSGGTKAPGQLADIVRIALRSIEPIE